MPVWSSFVWRFQKYLFYIRQVKTPAKNEFTNWRRQLYLQLRPLLNQNIDIGLNYCTLVAGTQFYHIHYVFVSIQSFWTFGFFFIKVEIMNFRVRNWKPLKVPKSPIAILYSVSFYSSDVFVRVLLPICLFKKPLNICPCLTQNGATWRHSFSLAFLNDVFLQNWWKVSNCCRITALKVLRWYPPSFLSYRGNNGKRGQNTPWAGRLLSKQSFRLPLNIFLEIYLRHSVFAPEVILRQSADLFWWKCLRMASRVTEGPNSCTIAVLLS